MTAVSADGEDVVFYDGACGLCHAVVRFAVHRDRAGALRYAPIGGATWQATFRDASSAPPRDTVSVRTARGDVLVRSAAVARILERLGGGWRRLGRILRALPRPLRDLGYRCVAALRRRVFARPASACPLVPESLRSRFLD